MRFEIRYCARCGDRILSGDFDCGRAFRLELRAVCSGCIRKELATMATVPGRPLVLRGCRRLRRRKW